MSARKTKPLQTKTKQKNEHLQVFVRCRPLSAIEINQRCSLAVDVQSLKEIAVQDRCNPKITKTYSFDKVFSPQSTQAEVYQNVVGPLITDVLAGYNCTVFAYGQTGSGKTFTMEGDINSSSAQIVSQDSKAGLIPRAMCTLFDELRVLQSEYTVRISLMELYNEELYDLLSPDEVPPKLRLFEDPTRKGSTLVHGLQEVMVHTQAQVLRELRKGSGKRQVAATLMNAQSSRSHTIFSVTVHFKESSVDGESLLRTGKLNLVDLAGSENISRSGSVDKRAREAASINQSLLTLSRVTSCLVEHQPHIPYRESKLTRLLQDSLGGRTKTSLIATISPIHSNTEETISTLDYASRAKSVANKPEINQKVSQTVVMKEYMDLINDLKRKLDLHRNGSGVYVNDENYRQIVDQNKDRHQKICDITTEIRTILQLMKSTEATFVALSSTLKDQKADLEKTENTIQRTREEINAAHEVFVKSSNEQEEAKTVLEALSAQESELRTQANHLANVTELAHSDSEKIHNRLDYSRVVLVENAAVLNKLNETARTSMELSKKMRSSLAVGGNILSQLLAEMGTLDNTLKRGSSVLFEAIHNYLEKLNSHEKKSQASMASLVAYFKEFSSKVKDGRKDYCSRMFEHIDHTEQELHGLCKEYFNLVMQLPIKSSSLVDFVKKSVENMNASAQTQFDETKRKFDLIDHEFDQRVININTILKNLQVAKEEPLISMRKQTKLVGEERSLIETHCNKANEALSAHKVKLLMKRDEIQKQVSLVKNETASSIHCLKLQEPEISSQCQAVTDTVVKCGQTILTGLKDRSESMSEIVGEACQMHINAKNSASELLLSDFESPLNELADEIRMSISSNENTLNSERASINDMGHCTQQLCETMSSKLQNTVGELKQYESKQKNALVMFSDSVKSSSLEIIEHLDTAKTAVSKMVSSEIRQDVRTGETPVRKSYGPISKLPSLPSPMVRQAKERTKRAPWKQLLRSPRKPLLSTMSSHDTDEECMASDSEVTVNRKKKEMSYMDRQRASSLSDLRSNGVFQRPRIPTKKYRNK